MERSGDIWQYQPQQTASDFKSRTFRLGNLYLEYRAPKGRSVRFNLCAPDGKLFEILDRDDNLSMQVTLGDIVSEKLAPVEAPKKPLMLRRFMSTAPSSRRSGLHIVVIIPSADHSGLQAYQFDFSITKSFRVIGPLVWTDIP